ncbi:50S ribosomal protein L23 [candidate division WWE3 bacterium RIFOXYC1_FULL_40_10]|uniref:Large ribosomal subunit protein uL23 n=1 Tax=candidate division WWE3 bacterium RIFOXYA2_FULL_46_9 TaxID=1802636 RepID=A0A1F4VZK3_UNCKA|nr:MAG: 50S ribosomal protein L23 [candidate division WWE3 bacterium RIFOXYB1_FULL_40_22]OGC61867.1 MAG: 50S ribosomal protein L23 [candidate division WWE3 bacterium RIFOXYA1_FULL_40_11]OGC62233.1 MAG: 50S ribosomal protein L23 [candidate division WWE3 bacterium RIFOXYA2_FULL_46_9]OGC64339.1 MAG: 50S ribosomal protein L23 [candidate division WWE3 bacterium RIFOXYB2_FULL_41_6]OGC66250.1 MAG: 50S ribosomal protein L23 [candidate division WWE3 bacterium RIFOXYC1_FULL_40_10]OGC67856.1 MAG: 50S rib
MQLSNNIIKPILSEKSLGKTSAENRYIFQITMKTSKGQVSEDIKKIFGVECVSVWTSVVPGKRRRITGTRKFMKTPRWKKAIISIKAGQSINLMPKE